MPCNVHEIINYCERNRINISPQNRQDWAMFCCALKVLNFDCSTFVALSNSGAENAARQVWRAERNPGRYVTTDQAVAKVVALAREAGVDVSQFRENSAARPTYGTTRPQPSSQPTRPSLPPVFVEPMDVARAAALVERTTLFNFLCRKFNPEDVRRVCAEYRVGASNAFAQYWPGMASAFPLINTADQVVDVHLMAYDEDGHRRKCADMWKCQTFLLAKRKQNDRRADWPLFGEHLTTRRPLAPVGIVESEKTALIAAIAAPQFVWCATLSLANLNPRRLAKVRERDIYLFPDRDGIEAWKAKSEALTAAGFGRVYLCSQYIAANAQGEKDDLADIILQNL